MRKKGKSVEHRKFVKELYAKKNPKAIIGIYRITHLVSGEFYIGSSTDIEKRWSVHLYELKNRVHGNYKLQKCYDTHSDFRWEVIWKSVQKPMDRNKLYEVEQHHIDTLRPSLNIELIVSMKKERPKKGSVKRLPASEPPQQKPYVPFSLRKVPTKKATAPKSPKVLERRRLKALRKQAEMKNDPRNKKPIKKK